MSGFQLPLVREQVLFPTPFPPFPSLLLWRFGSELCNPKREQNNLKLRVCVTVIQRKQRHPFLIPKSTVRHSTPASRWPWHYEAPLHNALRPQKALLSFLAFLKRISGIWWTVKPNWHSGGHGDVELRWKYFCCLRKIFLSVESLDSDDHWGRWRGGVFKKPVIFTFFLKWKAVEVLWAWNPIPCWFAAIKGKMIVFAPGGYRLHS